MTGSKEFGMLSLEIVSGWLIVYIWRQRGVLCVIERDVVVTFR